MKKKTINLISMYDYLNPGSQSQKIGVLTSYLTIEFLFYKHILFANIFERLGLMIVITWI